MLPPAGSAASGTPYAGDPGTASPVAPSAKSELPPGAVATTTTPAHANRASASVPSNRVSSPGCCTRSNSGADPCGDGGHGGLRPGRRRGAVARLLGRDPGGAFTVAVRRDDGTPVVIANEPFLRDGTPMPTRYWLVDPDLRTEVGRLEAPGGVRAAEAEVDAAAVADGHCAVRVGARRTDPVRVDGPPPEWRGGRHPRGASSASTPTWPGGWPGATTRSGHGRRPTWAVPPGRLSPSHRVVGQTREPARIGRRPRLRHQLHPAPGGRRTGHALGSEMRITRLGQGVDARRRLDQDAIDRTLGALREFRTSWTNTMWGGRGSPPPPRCGTRPTARNSSGRRRT